MYLDEPDELIEADPPLFILRDFARRDRFVCSLKDSFVSVEKTGNVKIKEINKIRDSFFIVYSPK